MYHESEINLCLDCRPSSGDILGKVAEFINKINQQKGSLFISFARKRFVSRYGDLSCGLGIGRVGAVGASASH
jgi:hypothetical protein